MTEGMNQRLVRPSSTEDVRQAIQQFPRLIARGGGTKWGTAGLSGDGDVVVLDITGLAGIVDYDPAEFTVTARAGTRLADLERLLAEHDQYLPFDPLLVEAGATLGGTVATGVSGACRLRFGGVRDFVLGLTFVDGTGRIARGGGRVVKNAAGYDLPKLFCGSQGRFGVITELTFKVFPRPQAFATIRFTFDRVQEAAAAMRALFRSPLEPHALELAGPGVEGPGYTLFVRIGGPAATMASWLDRVEESVGRPGDRLAAGSEEEAAVWRRFRELEWAAGGGALLRLYARPTAIETLDELLAHHGALRVFSQAGSAAWALFPTEPDWDALTAALAGAGITALCWRGGPPGVTHLVPPAGVKVARAVKGLLDPAGRFPPFGWKVPA
ncbi:MAG TPA: FAD-binding protein [Thermaerobacter sp.]